MFQIYAYNIRIINPITVLILKMCFLKLRQIVNTFNFVQYDLISQYNESGVWYKFFGITYAMIVDL